MKLEQEIENLQVKYDEDVLVAASRQQELSKSLEVLKEESSEETQYLLQQITELQEKYDAGLRFFVAKADLDPRKLFAVGYGEYRPLVPNDITENIRLNRRVDIIVLPE